MTHQEWLEEMKSALQLPKRRAARAASRLNGLARRAAIAERTAIGQWHVEQAIAAAGAVLSGAKRHREASALYRRLGRKHEEALTYHGQALVSALASAALELNLAGQRAQAARLVQRAQHWAKRLGNTNVLLEKSTVEVSLRTRRGRIQK